MIRPYIGACNRSCDCCQGQSSSYDNNNITIEYDSAENTLDALADLEQSSDDLIDENAILTDLIKGTNSDIRDEADRVGKTFSEDERVESETTAISYSDEVNELRTQRDNAIVKYSLIKEIFNYCIISFVFLAH